MEIKIELELSDDAIDRIADRMIEKGGFKKSEPDLEKTETTYTTKEVSNMLEVSRETITRHIRAEILIAHRPGKSYIITETNLKNYINGSDL